MISKKLLHFIYWTITNREQGIKILLGVIIGLVGQHKARDKGSNQSREYLQQTVQVESFTYNRSSKIVPFGAFIGPF